MKIFRRKLHRWLGLLMALQIIAWMASGLYFSLIPITEIRGEHLTRPADGPDVQQLASLVHPGRAEKLLNEQLGDDWKLDGMELVNAGGQTLWRIEGESNGKVFKRLLAADGRDFIPRLTEEGARARALDWLLEPADPVSVEWVEQAGAGSEIRGRAMPVWRVEFSGPESLRLYIDPWTGELLARRTDRWRIFDFLWMLHIMDFDTRDNFNQPLLQVAAALGLVIALSGVVFWAMTTRLFRRRRRLAGAGVR
jgi:uncharacterized iron-regulated membrane protein